jgi:hypothetical protein
MKVCVVGTGYVGLTTGVCLAFLGHDVTCVDYDEAKVELLRAGGTPIYEPHMTELLAEAAEHLSFTTSYADAVPGADVVFIAVQTPSQPDGNPDLAYLRSAAETVGENIGAGFTVVVNKSTVPIGSGNWVDAILREAFERTHARRADDRQKAAQGQAYGEGGDIVVPSNDRRGGGQNELRRSGQKRFPRGADFRPDPNLGGEAVAAARDRGDIGQLRVRRGQGPPQGGDVDLEIALVDVGVRPSGAHQLLLADELAPLFHEQTQDVERAGADPHRASGVQKQPALRHQLVVVETEDALATGEVFGRLSIGQGL